MAKNKLMLSAADVFLNQLQTSSEPQKKAKNKNISADEMTLIMKPSFEIKKNINNSRGPENKETCKLSTKTYKMLNLNNKR
jgi:hypothetical protein